MPLPVMPVVAGGVTAVVDGVEVPAPVLPFMPDEPVVSVAGVVVVVVVVVAAVVAAVVAGVVTVVSAVGVVVVTSCFLQPPSRAATAIRPTRYLEAFNGAFMVTPLGW